MRCVLVFANETGDRHLDASAAYVRLAIGSLDLGSDPIAWSQQSGSWDALREEVLRPLSDSGERWLLAFYTHGLLRGDGCRQTPSCALYWTDERCSCVIAGGGKPILRNADARFMKGALIYGATACFTGLRLGPAGVAGGATGFLGYVNEFWHAMPDADLGLPFSDIVNSALPVMLSGKGTEAARQEVLTRSDQWLSGLWKPGEEPRDWWVVEICIRRNRESLVAG